MRLNFDLLILTFELLEKPLLKFSEETSLLSDSSEGPIEYWTQGGFPESANDALDLLLVLPLLVHSPGNYDQVESIRNHIAKMVSNHKAEGKWKKVEEILLKSYSVVSVLETWDLVVNDFSECDWFGNIVPRMKRAIRATKLRKKYPRHYLSFEEQPRTKINKPQRKRGYNDKGSLRPADRWLPKELGELETVEKYEVKPIEPSARYWFRAIKLKRRKGLRGSGG